MRGKISQLRGHYVIDFAVITELIFVNYVQAYDNSNEIMSRFLYTL